MITEKSCGAVVFTNDGGIVKYVIVESRNGFYGFPKGHVECGETELETARREVLEEIGVTIEFVDGFRKEDTYTFLWDGETRQKEVVYFLARLSGGEIKPQERELSGAYLLDCESAMNVLQFENLKRILNEANGVALRSLERNARCIDKTLEI